MITKYIILSALTLLSFLPATIFSQQISQRQYTETVIEHKKSGEMVIKVNNSRTLYEVVSALNDEYGWTVDYEDPPYIIESSLIDVTDPKWRAQHPDAPGFKIPAGGAFQFEYDEKEALSSSAGEAALLKKLVSEYNQTNNPGTFVIRSDENNRFSIIGITDGKNTEQISHFVPILDTLISIPIAPRSADETVDLILNELSAKSGTALGQFGVASNLLIQSKVLVGGDNVPARTVLLQTLNATNRTVVWSLLFDATGNTVYALNTRLAERVLRCKAGN